MTLCIIDMQPYFGAYEQALNGVVKEIYKAKKYNDNIIIVNYIGCGPEGQEIQQALKGYKKIFHCKKPWNDGSKQIFNICKKNKIPIKNIKICGINLGICVYETVEGIVAKYKSVKKIKVLTKATWCTQGFKYALKEIKYLAKEHSRIEIIS